MADMIDVVEVRQLVDRWLKSNDTTKKACAIDLTSLIFSTDEVTRLRKEVADMRAILATATAKLGSFEGGLQYGNPLALRTENGHLICAEGGGGGEVNATRTDVGAWETMIAERPPNSRVARPSFFRGLLSTVRGTVGGRRA